MIIREMKQAIHVDILQALSKSASTSTLSEIAGKFQGIRPNQVSQVVNDGLKGEVEELKFRGL
jgi:hypothetical protein